MKKNQNGEFADFLKVGEMALSALLGAGSALGAKAAESRDTLVRKLDLVTREEFDAAFAMLRKVRAAQTAIEARLAQIENAHAPAQKKKSTPRSAPAKKQNRAK